MLAIFVLDIKPKSNPSLKYNSHRMDPGEIKDTPFFVKVSYFP